MNLETLIEVLSPGDEATTQQGDNYIAEFFRMHVFMPKSQADPYDIMRHASDDNEEVTFEGALQSVHHHLLCTPHGLAVNAAN